MRGQQHSPAALYLRDRPGTHCTGGWVGPRAGLDGRKISPPTGIRSLTVQPAAQSLYRLSYPDHEATINVEKWKGLTLNRFTAHMSATKNAYRILIEVSGEHCGKQEISGWRYWSNVSSVGVLWMLQDWFAFRDLRQLAVSFSRRIVLQRLTAPVHSTFSR